MLRQVWPLIATGIPIAWWRHQIEAFSASLAICAVNSPVPGEFPAQRPVTRSFDVFFDLRLNKRLSKQSWGWWFETLSRPLWCHCNGGILKEDIWISNCLAENFGVAVFYTPSTYTPQGTIQTVAMRHCLKQWRFIDWQFINTLLCIEGWGRIHTNHGFCNTVQPFIILHLWTPSAI